MTQTTEIRSRRLKGALFDKDGTLFDFEKSWTDLGRRVIHQLADGRPDLMLRLAASVGFDPATGRFAANSLVVAGALDQIAAVWADVLPQWRADELAEWLGREGATMDPRALVPAADDLPAALGAFQTAGLSLGVSTHDAAAAAEAHLLAAAVRERFVFLAGYDSGYAPKPDPESLCAFAEQIGAAPSEIVMLGDSLHDLGMARAAGAVSVGVLTGPATTDDLAPLADVVLPSISDAPAWLAAHGFVD